MIMCQARLEKRYVCHLYFHSTYTVCMMSNVLQTAASKKVKIEVEVDIEEEARAGRVSRNFLYQW